MEIKNAGATHSKSNQLRNVNTGHSFKMTVNMCIFQILPLQDVLSEDVSMCPYEIDWNEVAVKVCNNSGRLLYHCMEKQEGGLIQLCTNPITIDAGNKTIIECEAQF